jgi:trehalose 6-phosphate synthase/phosphatase
MKSGKRHQGKILRLHFACHAELPLGTTLRVTSTIGPPPQNDVPDDNKDGAGDDHSVSSDIFSTGTLADKGSVSANLARMHNRLLQNTVEMYTDPESYPIWKTTKPVVVIDDGGSKENALAAAMDRDAADQEGGGGGAGLLGPLLHRYRYVAVTPGATIDWSMCTKRDHDDDGSASTGRGNLTAATTPPGSDDEEEHANTRRSTSTSPPYAGEVGGILHEGSNEEEDAEFQFPPVLYENPLPPGSEDSTKDNGSDDGNKGKKHKRHPSLFDALGNPVVLSGSQFQSENPYSSGGLSSGTSFASLVGNHTPQAVLTWEGVSALPYRTRSLAYSDEDDAQDIKVVDHWNASTDPSFQAYWSLEQGENDNIKGATITGKQDTQTVEANEDDDPMDNSECERSAKESMFIACYHLPVILTRDVETSLWTACWSESLIAKSEMYGVSSTRKTTWLGTVSNIPVQALRDPKEREAIRKVLEPMDCIPIFFEEEHLLDLMYLGFCKQVLWPSFHNVDLLELATNGWGQRQKSMSTSDPVEACRLAAAEAHTRKQSGIVSQETLKQVQSDWDQSRLDSWWQAYIKVNQKFSHVVARLVSGGDIVWVHDYHLALLPRMLREVRKEADVVTDAKKAPLSSIDESAEDGGAKDLVRPVRMVFFIHVPFPTSQVFRELEHGEALLEGMLHADVVGFHAFDHARHFLNAAKRILGLTYESLSGGLIGVRHRGTKILVTVSNVSVETDIIDALLVFPSVEEESAFLKKKHEGRRIIAAIDVAQRLSGVSLKLLAFERLLTDYPVWQSQIVLLQRCLIPATRRVDEADTLREVRSLVQRIQTRFGHNVIDYDEQVGSVLPIDQRLAIWTTSHVVMHTPIREGLNLFPLEYVYARKEPATPGIVIASEFSAVSAILNGALRVNPFDIKMCVTSLDYALSMSAGERDARRGRDIDFVSTCPSGLWTRNVLRDLNDATHQSTRTEAVADGSPDSILAREIELGLEKLDLPSLEHAYKTSKKRVIFIDFNGTLVVKEPAGKYLKREILGTSGFKPSQLTSLALGRLCADPKNTVYVVSGDSQQNLEMAVGNIPGLGLAASNGACFANPGGAADREWKYLDFGVDWNAVKKVAMPIISKFTARTNGSFVKLTHSSIGWSYYSCDPEWGSLQASHLVTELGEALRSFDVRFVALKGILEVVPKKLHKGHIVKQILEETHKNGAVDFMLCMGDDISDEKMFSSVINFASDSDGRNTYAFNVAVGKKPTKASFFVEDASEVGNVLVALSGDVRLVERQASNDGSRASQEDFFA